MSTPVISICIPAYKEAPKLAQLLDSIAAQTFRDFEVIVSDDSPDSSVRECIEKYKGLFPLTYRHNQEALGSPENWNAAMTLASGHWIKLMHHDDWFTGPHSLQSLYELTANGASFVFSGYQIVENEKVRASFSISDHWLRRLQKDPRQLISYNVIGHPSVTLHRNTPAYRYDKRMKWMVDVDFYIRCMQMENGFAHTKTPLVNIGYHEGQITKSVFTNREIVVGENMLLLQKLGPDCLDHIRVYDYFWRMLRNYEIRTVEGLQAVYAGEIPAAIIRMIRFRNRMPEALLKPGVLSKGWMLLSFLSK